MGQLLKQSTAVNITVLMVDSSDHVSGKTGLSGGMTIYATKAAGTPGAITPTITELDSTNAPGLYKLALTTGHTDTLGELQLHVTASGADPTDTTHQVLVDLPGAWPSAATIAQAVWDALLTAITTAGSIGKLIKDNLDAAITSRLATSGYTAPPSAADNADAVWDEALAGHGTAGSAGAALTAAGSAGDPWATALPGAYGSGTAGKIVGDNLNATVSSRLASASYTAPDNATITAIDAKTTNLPADPAATSDIPTANDNADALLDRSNGIETGRTPRQGLRLILAALAGKLSGAATNTVVIRDTNDTKDRITATVDSDGNRTAITYDAS